MGSQILPVAAPVAPALHGCGKPECSKAASACTAVLQAGMMNGAFTRLDDGVFAFVANDVRGRSPQSYDAGNTTGGETTCNDNLALVGVAQCNHASSLQLVPNTSIYLPAAIPDRKCQDLVNFRSRGPEDVRLLPLGGRQAMLFFPDFVDYPAQGQNPPYGRHMFMRSIFLPTTGRLVLGTKMRLSPASAEVATLERLEKNWSPFEADGKLYVHQWLDSINGSAVVLRVNRTSGRLDQRYESSSLGLRAAAGLPAGTFLSGGTPAIRLNATHFFAIGHSRSKRSYAMFGYVFSGSAPFRILGATHEFTINHMAEGIDWDPPPSSWGRVQFPTGLGWSEGSEWLLLSWGFHDRDTMVSRLRLSELLSRVQRLIPVLAGDCSCTTASGSQGCAPPPRPISYGPRLLDFSDQGAGVSPALLHMTPSGAQV